MDIVLLPCLIKYNDQEIKAFLGAESKLTVCP